METMEKHALKLELLLAELNQLITIEFGSNPYDEVATCRNIVAQRNYNQFSSITKKIKNVAISLYNRKLTHRTDIDNKLDEIYQILKKCA